MIPTLYGAFFLSGCSALIFETLWFRQAGLAFGNSVWASSLVLAGFMAGMAAGNGLAVRMGDRVRRPLRLYAMAEVAVALSGVALVLGLPAMGGTLAPVLRPLMGSLATLNIVRLVVAFLVLLIPSTAMGITLPLLTHALTSRAVGGTTRFGPALGQLYGWNTAGAVAGVAVTEFVLVGLLGIRGTAIAAGLLNVAVAAVAFWIDRRWKGAGVPAAPTRAEPSPSAIPADWLLAAFGAGFALLALEVIWFRLLLLAAIGYSSTFAVMLGTVLAGIAIGGLAGGAVLRRWPEAHLYAGPVAWLAGALTVGSYAVFLLRMAALSDHLVTAVPEILAIGALLMLPVALVSGVLFTLAGAGLRAGSASDTGAAGTLTFANTLGSALGSLVGGFLLLPLLGMERAVFVIAVIYAATGALLWARTAPRRPHAIGALVLIAAALAAFPFGGLTTRLQRFPVERYAALRGTPSSGAARVEAIREGVAETLIYVKAPILREAATHALFVNATSMADTDWESRRYMKLYVYWPMALHPHLKRALLIAYGVGNTAKAMTDSAGLTSIDVVDISKDVLTGSSVIYPKDADNPLRDPRVRMHVEDGRYFLQTTDQRFDLITSEPPPPRSAGVVNLYTREYFQLIHSRLTEGGMAAYWLPTHTISGDVTRSVIRAFCDAFEDCSLWHGIASQLMLAGTRGATGPVSAAHFAAQWQTLPVLRELRAVGLERPEQLGALFIGDAAFLRRLTANTPPLVDDRPKRIDAPSASADGDAELDREFADVDACRARFRTSPLIARLFPPEVIEASLPYFDFQRHINAYTHAEALSIDRVHDLLTTSPLKAPVLWMLASSADLQRGIEVATPEELAEPALQFHLGVRLLSERSYAAAARVFSGAQADPGLRQQALGLRAYAYCLAGQPDRARALVVEHRSDVPRSPFWTWLDGLCQVLPISRQNP